MKAFLIRQGDVLIRSIDAIPVDAHPLDCKGVATLALGEATGHHHAIYSDKVRAFGASDRDTLCSFFIAEEPISLAHQEHTALEIPKGTHEVVRQRTYVAGVAKRVVD